MWLEGHIKMKKASESTKEEKINIMYAIENWENGSRNSRTNQIISFHATTEKKLFAFISSETDSTFQATAEMKLFAFISSETDSTFQATTEIKPLAFI